MMQPAEQAADGCLSKCRAILVKAGTSLFAEATPGLIFLGGTSTFPSTLCSTRGYRRSISFGPACGSRFVWCLLTASVSRARCGAGHRPCFRADDRRRQPIPAQQTTCQYLGLIPNEHSSGGRQRMGAICRQENRLLRVLLVEAANSAVRFNSGFRKQYQHRCHQKHRAVAKVAAARKLAVRLYWMLHTQTPYPQVLTPRAA